jgi:putative acetyltransferase
MQSFTLPLRTSLEKPPVSFFVARNEGAVIGCAAWVVAGDGTAEIKRMFVDPQARGLKAASRLMDVLEDTPKARGVFAIRLETGIRQP